MSIQYPAPGFKLTTFWLWVSSLNHWTRAPALILFLSVGRYLEKYKKLKVESLRRLLFLAPFYKSAPVGDYFGVDSFTA